MKKILLLLFVFFPAFLQAQNVIDWDGKYQLQLSDFQSPSSKIGGANVNMLNPGTGIGFSFQMSNWEFLFTKNFNSKVSCTFDRDAASIVASDSASADALLRFAQFQFDLSELYARKFRKELYEKKGAFSNVSFFKPLFNKIQKELNARNSTAGSETNMGRNAAKLKTLHKQVLAEIHQMPDFCKSCKPSGKKKKR